MRTTASHHVIQISSSSEETNPALSKKQAACITAAACLAGSLSALIGQSVQSNPWHSILTIGIPAASGLVSFSAISSLFQNKVYEFIETNPTAQSPNPAWQSTQTGQKSQYSNLQ